MWSSIRIYECLIALFNFFHKVFCKFEDCVQGSYVAKFAIVTVPLQ